MSTPSTSPDSSPQMSSPVVSIVLVSYNQAQFLGNAIESLLSQDYSAVEVIVMDGGSTDGSAAMIEKYRDQFAYVHIGPDGGAAAALNEGFEHATGRYFAYLNSDDVLLPQAASEWVKAFEKSGADVVYGDILIVDEAGKPAALAGRKTSLFKAAPFNLRRMAAGGCTIPQQATAWKREVHEAVGGFVASNRSCWDGEFFVDAALKGLRFSPIGQVLGLFRIHSSSISGTGKNEEARRVDKARLHQKWLDGGFRLSSGQKRLLIKWDQLLRALRYLTEGRKPT